MGYSRTGPQQIGQEVDEVVVLRLIQEPKPTVRPNKAERMEAVRRMLVDGRRSHYIAPRVGITVRTVDRYRKELGLARPPVPRGTTRAAVKAAVLADPKISAAEIARNLGLNNSATWNHLKKLQAAGELPPRDNRNDIRNPRSKGLPRYGVPL